MNAADMTEKTPTPDDLNQLIAETFALEAEDAARAGALERATLRHTCE